MRRAFGAEGLRDDGHFCVALMSARKLNRCYVLLMNCVSIYELL